MKKSLGIIAVVSCIAMHAGSALACQVVGYANGEALCATTSDGPQHPYKVSTFTVTTAGHGAEPTRNKALLAAEIANRRARHIY